MTTLRFALAQFDFPVGAVARNGQRVRELMAEARDRHSAQLIAFPELTLSGYPPEDLLLRPSFLAACESTDDTYVPGRIPKATAVAIAMQANKQYPYPLSKVTRVSWRPEQGYWAIDFKDEDEDFGKFYLVNGRGKIVGVGNIQGDNYY